MKDIPYLVKLLLDAFIAALCVIMLCASISMAHAQCGGFYLLLDVYADGRHSVITNPQGFASFQACKTAGLTAKSRWEHLGEQVDFICVSHK